MKHTFSILPGIIFAVAVHAQSPTITSANNFVIGDKQITLTADSVGIYEGPAGTNLSWDFSKLKQDSAMDSSFVRYVDPKKTAYSGDFNSADIAGQDSSHSGLSYTYYDMTNSGVNVLGYASYDSAAMSANVIKYTDVLTQITYPVSYGYTYHDTYSTGTSSGQSGTYIRGSINIKADAYGTLKIRNKQYDNVLRLNEVTKEFDSLSLGFAFILFYETNTTYTYYTPGKKSPVLTILYASVTSDTTQPGTVYKMVTFNDFDHDLGLASAEADNISFSLFPNPAKGTAGIYLTAKQASEPEIMISNELGQVVKIIPKVRLQEGANHLNIDLEGMSSGIYFMDIISNGKIGRHKIVVD